MSSNSKQHSRLNCKIINYKHSLEYNDPIIGKLRIGINDK